MSEQNLWQQLQTADLVTGDMPVAKMEQEPTLWYVRILQGFAGWVAALFLIGFLGFGVAGLFEHGVALIVLGIIINISAYVYYKTNPDSDFFEQLVLVFSLTGQFLFAFGLFELNGFQNHQWMVVIGLYQLVLMFFINNYLHRFLSTWFAVIALFWGYELLIYSGLGSAVVATLFVWLWLDRVNWDAQNNFYEPIAYALGFSLLQLNIQNQFWLFDMFRYSSPNVNWWLLNAYWVSAILNSAVLIYFITRMVKEHQIKLSGTTGKLVILAAIVMLFSALPVIGLSSALLVLLVGFARQNKILLAMGVMALIGFVGWYYYSLHETLLFKSLVLLAIGLTLVTGYLLLKKIYQQDEPLSAGTNNEKHAGSNVVTKSQKMIAGITLLMGLVGVNHAIWEKEVLLENGDSVLLELAPVDPRSLMQGDYMRLRFAVANDIRTELNTNESPTTERNIDGFVYVTLDDKGIGTFHALKQDMVAEKKLIKMQYRMRNNRIQFATNAFFFQEGDAKIFDSALYGEFKVAENGELLLKAMYDKDLKLLGENRLD